MAGTRLVSDSVDELVLGHSPSSIGLVEPGVLPTTVPVDESCRRLSRFEHPEVLEPRVYERVRESGKDVVMSTLGTQPFDEFRKRQGQARVEQPFAARVRGEVMAFQQGHERVTIYLATIDLIETAEENDRDVLREAFVCEELSRALPLSACHGRPVPLGNDLEFGQVLRRRGVGSKHFALPRAESGLGVGSRRV